MYIIKPKLIITGLLYCLIFVSLFDPGNNILGLKTPLFVLIFSIWIVFCLMRNDELKFHNIIVVWVITFIVIALLSILRGFFYSERTDTPFFGFERIGTFLFLIFVLIIDEERIDLSRIVVRCLTLMALLTIVIFIIRGINPSIGISLYNFGNYNGSFTYANRHYGFIDFQSVYFHTSSLMIIALVWYLWDAVWGSRSRSSAFLLIAVGAALIISGSRNNILFCIIAIFLVMLTYSNHKSNWIIIGIVLLLAAFALFSDTFLSLFDPSDVSNKVKLSYFSDYQKVWSDLNNLLFGTGVGSVFHISILNDIASVTELTYFELVRCYGIFVAIIVFLMMLYPAYYLAHRAKTDRRFFVVGYIVYLGICMTNPLFFSSSGVLLIGIMFSERIENNAG
jgi:hypothetical protein